MTTTPQQTQMTRTITPKEDHVSLYLYRVRNLDSLKKGEIPLGGVIEISDHGLFVFAGYNLRGKIFTFAHTVEQRPEGVVGVIEATEEQGILADPVTGRIQISDFSDGIRQVPIEQVSSSTYLHYRNVVEMVMRARV